MSVVVSDTSPLHYLILCEVVGILPGLFQRVFIPPQVFSELQQANTPALVRDWAQNLPEWVAVQAPQALDSTLGVDAGETAAICLAREIKAAAVLMDDRAGRNAARQCGLAVVGTIGIIEQAAIRGMLDLPSILDRLLKTNARLDSKLIQAALDRNRMRSP